MKKITLFLLFISGGAYRPGDFEVGISQGPREGSLIEPGDMGNICFESPGQPPLESPDSDLMKTGLMLAALSIVTSSASLH